MVVTLVWGLLHTGMRGRRHHMSLVATSHGLVLGLCDRGTQLPSGGCHTHVDSMPQTPALLCVKVEWCESCVVFILLLLVWQGHWGRVPSTSVGRSASFCLAQLICFRLLCVV